MESSTTLIAERRMPWNLETFDHEGRPILETHYAGVLPPGDLAAAVQATMAHASTMAEPLLIGNCSALAGGHSPFDLYDLADMLAASGLSERLKEAVLMPALPKPLDDVRFWETACLNRGIRVRIFTDRRDALAWLVDDLTP
jgi:hypothetical protein